MDDEVGDVLVRPLGAVAFAQQRIGAEFAVGLLGVELGGRGEDVEPVGAVVAGAGGGGDAPVLAGSAPGVAGADGADAGPAFEDVSPVGAGVEVVAGPLAGLGVPFRVGGGNR